MKKILAKIFGATGSNIAEKISDIIDKHTFSKVEKAQFEKEMAEVWINAESDIQKNVTERWKYDLSSDSFLSKNVRPLVLIFLVVSTVLMVFIDAGVLTFDLKESHTDLLQIILLTCIGAYFGGRSYEKIKRQ
jgi:tRNA U38,U39,U40 pseudouridine synthase TruA